MRIAFVHNQCLPYRHFLFQALAQRFPIDFFFFNQQPEALPPGLDATVLKGFRIPEASDYWIQPGLRRALSRRKYDLIALGDLGGFNSTVAYRVARRTGTPFLVHPEEWDWVRHPRRWLRRGLENRMLTEAAAVLVYGTKHRRFFAERGVAEDHLHPVPYCVDVPVTEMNNATRLHRELMAAKGQRTMLLNIGRYVGFKGQHQLLHAQALLEQANPQEAPLLVLAGNGPLLERNRKLAVELGVRHVHWVKRFVTPEDKAVLYGLADVFALTSTRTAAYETWGLVCNEAAAFGKPIVVTDAVGAGESVVRSGKNGLIVPDGDYPVLAKVLHVLLTDPELRTQMGEASRSIWPEFAPEVMVERYSAVFEHLLGSGAAL